MSRVDVRAALRGEPRAQIGGGRIAVRVAHAGAGQE